MQIDYLEDGWVQLVESPPGWESFTVDLRSDLVSGEPRVTGLRLEPRPDASPTDVTLTVNRLRTLNVGQYAALVYHATHLTPATLSEVVAGIDRADRAGRGRAATDPETVAAIYEAARREGRPDPRRAVCDALSISTRTADRYISQARRTGLLGAYDERKADQ